MMSLDAIPRVISRTTHTLDVITSISRYNRRSNLLHFLCSFLKNITASFVISPMLPVAVLKLQSPYLNVRLCIKLVGPHVEKQPCKRCRNCDTITVLTRDFVDTLYASLVFGFFTFSHYHIGLAPRKEEKMFRHLNIFLNYLVAVSNRGAGV